MTNLEAYELYQAALAEIQEQIEVFADLLAQEALESRIKDDPSYLAKFAVRSGFRLGET